MEAHSSSPDKSLVFANQFSNQQVDSAANAVGTQDISFLILILLSIVCAIFQQHCSFIFFSSINMIFIYFFHFDTTVLLVELGFALWRILFLEFERVGHV